MKASRGFTLLELLLALMITATIAGTLATSLFVGFRARSSAERAIGTTRAMDAAGDMLTRDLSNALPPTGILAGAFNGAADSISFYCTGQESHATVKGDFKLVEYALADDPNNPGHGILVRRVTTNLLSPTQIDPTDEPICRNVESIAFSYFDGSNWTDTWDSTQQDNTLPIAVKMTLQLTSSSAEGEAMQSEQVIPVSCGVANTSQLSTGTLGGGL